MNVIIYGAGSIGNHLAHGCRNKGWNVLICDVDAEALERTKNDIYPARYGKWDEQIRLTTSEKLPDEAFDLAIIGTPPDSHLEIARSVLTASTGSGQANRPPKVLLVEKTGVYTIAGRRARSIGHGESRRNLCLCRV